MAKRPSTALDLAGEAVGAAALIGAAAVTALRPRPEVIAGPVLPPADPAPTGIVGVIDRFQQRHRPVSLIASTFRAYGAVRGGDAVSLIAYRSFLSVFPLLIALTTLSNRLLASHPDLRDRLLKSTVASVPLLGDQLRTRAVTGSLVTVVAGLAFAIWSGLSAVLTLESALCDQWRVHRDVRSSFVVSRLRAIATLLIVLVGLAGSTTASAFIVSGKLIPALLGAVAAIVINASAVWAVSRVIVPGKHRHLPGAIVAAVILGALQVGGTALVTRSLVGASATYGTFATVVALTAWFSLNAQIVVLSTSLNVVLEKRWFPASLSGRTPWPVP